MFLHCNQSQTKNATIVALGDSQTPTYVRICRDLESLYIFSVGESFNKLHNSTFCLPDHEFIMSVIYHTD